MFDVQKLFFLFFDTIEYIYFALKNLVLWARSEFFGSALEFGVSNNKSQAPISK
jgi:hypothetical protein